MERFKAMITLGAVVAWRAVLRGMEGCRICYGVVKNRFDEPLRARRASS